NRIKEYYSVFNDYDVEFIISDKPINKYPGPGITDFYNLIQLKIDSYTRWNSKANLIQFKNTLLKIYGDKLPINKINQIFLNDFIEQLKKTKSVPQTKVNLKNFFKIYNFAIKQGYMQYRPLEYNKKDFTYHIEKRALSIDEIRILQKQWKDLTLYKNGNTYTYELNNPLNALSIFLMMYAMQGIAPCDIALLKVKDFKVSGSIPPIINDDSFNNIYDLIIRDENSNLAKHYLTRFTKQQFKELAKRKKSLAQYDKENEKIYCIKTVRKKTGKLVDIEQYYDILNPLIEDYFYKLDGTEKNENDYFLNVFKTDKTYTDKQIYIKTKVAFLQLNKTLKEYLGKIYGFDVSNFSYYCARHSFLTIGNYLDVPFGLLAELAAHDHTSLQNYLKGFEKKPKLEANRKIWNLGDNE
ncbi:hypothetical protein EZS27_031851, partial [termite gut metagenome]